MRKLIFLLVLVLLAAPICAQKSSQQVMLSQKISAGGGGDITNDTFTESGSNVNLSSHIGEVGATWTLHPSYSGTVTVDAMLDRIYLTSAAAAMYYSNGVPSSANYCNELAFRRMSQISTNASVFVGLDTSVDTGLHLRLNDNGTTVVWEVMDRVTGGNTVLNGGAAFSVSNIPSVGGAAVTGKICRSGTSVTVFFNGVQDTSLNSTTGITSVGRCGTRISGTGSSTTGIHLDSMICQ